MMVDTLFCVYHHFTTSGAKRRHILFQFLCESCIISVLGGVIGLVISFATVNIYNILLESTAELNWQIGLLSISFCAVIGIVFGIYPASKASRLQPIEALHSL